MTSRFCPKGIHEQFFFMNNSKGVEAAPSECYEQKRNGKIEGHTRVMPDLMVTKSRRQIPEHKHIEGHTVGYRCHCLQASTCRMIEKISLTLEESWFPFCDPGVTTELSIVEFASFYSLGLRAVKVKHL